MDVVGFGYHMPSTATMASFSSAIMLERLYNTSMCISDYYMLHRSLMAVIITVGVAPARLSTTPVVVLNWRSSYAEIGAENIVVGG